MKGRGLGLILAIALVLGLVNLLFLPRTLDPDSGTTLGRLDAGYGILWDLMSDLGYPAARLYEELDLDVVPVEETVWLLDPGFLRPQKGTTGADSTAVASLQRWIRSGGTALVFGSEDTDWSPWGWATEHHLAPELVVEGPWLRAPRRLPTVSWFRPSHDDAADLVRVRGEGHAFVIERHLGAGRLIGVADARVLSNRWMSEHEPALFAADLARELGLRWFEEYSHGLRQRRSLIAALGWERVSLLLLCTMTLLGTLLSRSRLWPARELQESAGPAPTLVQFVESVSFLLYKRGRRSPALVLQAYREGFLRRLRGQHRGYDRQHWIDRVAADPRLDEEARRWLLRQESPRNWHELEGAVRALEAYAERCL